MAHRETGLPKSPRLADVELPRTTGQLRQAAAAARTGNWRQPIIDSAIADKEFPEALKAITRKITLQCD